MVHKLKSVNWKPLFGGRAEKGKPLDKLPGKRGSRIIFVPQLVSDRYVHFSWLGESFCLRDYLGGRELRQAPGLDASAIWKLHEGPVFSDRHNYEDVDFWKEKLQGITDGVLGND